jgi:hypothetical protein
VAAEVIIFLLTNFSPLLFGLALIAATLHRGRGQAAERYLSWLLLLSIGGECLWAGLPLIFIPKLAASYVGWQVSPYQFEIGVADVALGVVAILSFWKSLDFKAAVVIFIAVFFGGLAIGHIRQIITTGDFSPGNGGTLLILTIAEPLLLVALLLAARRSR